jgi:hypothetical protein
VAHLRPFPSAIAIPVRNEEDHIGACLGALLGQSEPPDHIVLLINNTTDHSAEIARGMAAGRHTRVHVIERRLPDAEANAGTARRLAMDAAADLVGPSGVLLTTDADGRVPRHWVASNLSWLRHGIDAVCGMAAIDPVDEAAVPAHLVADDAAETRYTELLDEIDSLLDPRACDPWPRHSQQSGASIALTVAACRAVGGTPRVTFGEDRSLIGLLTRRDARIRHDPAVRVVVSGRTVGRAEGGMASTIARRIIAQDEWADDRLEEVEALIRRVRLRAECRIAWSAFSASNRALADRLEMPPRLLVTHLKAPFFGSGWAAIEASSPVLVRAPVAMKTLRTQLAKAEDVLEALRTTNCERASRLVEVVR